MLSKVYLQNPLFTRQLWKVKAVLASTMLLMAVTFANPSASAQAYKVLYSFQGAPDGAVPTSGLILVGSELYGSTQHGGELNRGSVFELNKTGQESVVFSFQSATGIGTNDTMVRDAAGYLYAAAGAGTFDEGRIIRLDPATGALTVVYSFKLPSGAYPSGTLLVDAAGNIYGPTFEGGGPGCGGYGCGAVYKLDAARKETVLHTFTGPPDGSYPMAGLVQDASGNLYGTTQLGGNEENYGIVFKIDPFGNETILHAFTGPPDGAEPSGGTLLLDSAGNLYGTTGEGGDSSCLEGIGCGVVFKFDTTTGTETILHAFAGGGDGMFPDSGLTMDPEGNLFGTTTSGGDMHCKGVYSGCGTIFKLDTSGNETALYRFNGTDGSTPFGVLLRTQSGTFYGNASDGGTAKHGVVYEFKP